MTARRFLSLLVVLLFAGVASAETPGLLARWQFDRQHLAGRKVSPLAGSLPAILSGPITFDASGPNAIKTILQLTGKSQPRNRFRVTEDINQARKILPVKSLTVEAWLRLDSAGEWTGFVSAIQDNGSYEKGWLLGQHNSRFAFSVCSTSTERLTYLESPRLFELGHWYQVVGTYDGRIQRLFIDGQLQAEAKTQSGPISYPPKGVFTLGAYEDDNEFYPLNGALEQVSLWNRALTPTEIRARFHLRESRFPGIRAVAPTVVDWPTWNRDNQRTAITEQRLALPLQRQWTHRVPVPAPAWPDPAGQDFWHRKHNLRARVTYDRAPHVVAAAGRVLLGHSADDTVRCLDLASGSLLWSVTVDGPVRLAPTISDDRVVFGSDDGHVYCLALADGRRHWRQRAAPDNRWIVGNERLTSAWPIRTGVLVEQGVAFCCAGLFPAQGVHQVAFNLADGRRLAANKVNVSAQGYLSRRSGKLFVATGRDPAGAFVAELKRRGKGVGRELSTLPEAFRYAFIGAAELRLGGGDGRVAAFDRRTGRQAWSATVDGRAWSLAIAGGHLLVSTDRGQITAFGSRSIEKPAVHDSRPRPVPLGKPPLALARALEAIPHRRGYAILLGSPSLQPALQLARHSRLQVHVVFDDEAKAAAARTKALQAGLAGRVTAIHHPADAPLPYVDTLFNLALVTGQAAARPLSSLQRLVRPWGGVVVRADDGELLARRGPLEGAGEWSHMYADAANTVCSDDRHVSGPLELQWFGRPGPQQMIDRHHRTVAPLFKAGRLFVPGDNRVIAADAYNGTQLWNLAIPGSRRIGAFRDCSYLAATDDSLYVAANDACLRLDGDTGKTLRTFRVPKAADGRPRDWGYLAVVGNTLVGSAVHPGGSRRNVSRKAIEEGTYYDSRPLVSSEYLFAFDRRTGRHLWSYHTGGGLLPNPAIAIHDGAVSLIESDNQATRKAGTGRATPRELFSKGARLVSLDLETGSVRFSRPHDFSAIQHSVYLAATGNRLVVVGSRNNGQDPKTSRVCYDIQVFDASEGDQVWKGSQTQSTSIGGSHGEQDHHPVIVGTTLYCEPFAWNLATGKRVPGFQWKDRHRRGCGTLTASASTVFFRDGNASMFDLESNAYQRLTTSTRPGCWINMIPAGGLLLVPEASSGCTCNYAIQTSLAFRQRRK
ncbi:MAG: PQQ-binding-like beta-propeller repeat protein [Planctomycetaceae bacterium]|jgi:outer membrane protein assembly factor BamB|nr:PQQ-binding-like beta-propeller repeat protein [Planctomycetaceae bacterium]